MKLAKLKINLRIFLFHPVSDGYDDGGDFFVHAAGLDTQGIPGDQWGAGPLFSALFTACPGAVGKAKGRPSKGSRTKMAVWLCPAASLFSAAALCPRRPAFVGTTNVFKEE